MAVDIRDVPCLPCQHGYNQDHVCDAPDHCPCDRPGLHVQTLFDPMTADPEGDVNTEAVNDR